MWIRNAIWCPKLSKRIKRVIQGKDDKATILEKEIFEKYFTLKRIPGITLKDLDPEGLIRNEDLVGLRQIEIWYAEKDDEDKKREAFKARVKAKYGK